MKTWFITGASRGFGREWTEAALERGDRVAAAARNPHVLDDLAERFGEAILPVRLDVTDREAAFSAVREAHDHFGRLDVVVNNAGYGQFGMIEELTEKELRDQLETNFFGAFWVTQAAVPLLRAQGSGHILQVSSIGGISAFANVGAYHASKWALEGFSQALAQEVAALGVRVTLIEPGGFATDWATTSARHSLPMAEYDPPRQATFRAFSDDAGTGPGDPRASAYAIQTVVDAENPPLRLFLGDGPLAMAEAEYGARLATWREWEHVAVAAQGN